MRKIISIIVVILTLIFGIVCATVLFGKWESIATFIGLDTGMFTVDDLKEWFMK